MAFGMLTSKWRILRRPLQVLVKHAGIIFLACTRLHNFIIDSEGGEVPNSDAITAIGGGEGDDSDDFHFFPSDVGVSTVPGNSIMRDILVDRISAMALVRPRYNLDRNRTQDKNDEDST